MVPFPDEGTYSTHTDCAQYPQCLTGQASGAPSSSMDWSAQMVPPPSRQEHRDSGAPVGCSSNALFPSSVPRRDEHDASMPEAPIRTTTSYAPSGTQTAQTEVDSQCCGLRITGCCPFNPLKLNLLEFLPEPTDLEKHPETSVFAGPMSARAVRKWDWVLKDRGDWVQTGVNTGVLGPESHRVPGWELTLSGKGYKHYMGTAQEPYDVSTKLPRKFRSRITLEASYEPTALHIRFSAQADSASERPEEALEGTRSGPTEDLEPIPGHRVVLFRRGRVEGAVVLAPLSAVSAIPTEFECWSVLRLDKNHSQLDVLKSFHDKLDQPSRMRDAQSGQ